MTHVTCWLTAKNRDQLQNPALGNRVWATFTFLRLNPTQPNLTHALIDVKFLDTTQINPWLDPMHDDDALLGVVHKSKDP